MATHMTETADPKGVASLAGGILSDAQDLLQKQIELFKVEIHDNLEKTKEISVVFGIGITVAMVGSVLLGIALSLFLVWAFPSLPYWAGFGIVGALLFIATGVLFGVYKQKLESISLLPERSMDAMKENLEWKTEPK